MKKKSTKNIKFIKIVTEKEALYDGSFLELPIPDQVIIDKSILFYNDPTPCFIHRSAVRNRLLSEMEHELLSCEDVNSNCTFYSEQLPLFLRYTSFPPAATIEIRFT
ncbi:hypothetical protein [Lachnoclostridium phytofermentans]|uniref:Uncharacterized protein n=1 Tax=Lachnoclostridium phytofermentans (strain ATCC 700394 / DSM 18823 / ISDg) TaxID=357809 RepID=A9KJE2_LACP7|nr:hypothetical protein [Lachnoclostridium phytofermentans]ABX42554.1 hypothetical protein Cphy_2188 [Lachnoclostridium phytofermentans ISDg]